MATDDENPMDDRLRQIRKCTSRTRFAVIVADSWEHEVSLATRVSSLHPTREEAEAAAEEKRTRIGDFESVVIYSPAPDGLME